MVRVLKDLHVSYSLREVGDFEVSHANVKAHCIDIECNSIFFKCGEISVLSVCVN